MAGLEHARRVIECQQAVYRNYMAMDNADYASVAAGFAPDGQWHRQGKVLTGPEAIRAELEKRPANRITAHLIHNPVVNDKGPASVRVLYLLVAYSHDPEAEAIPTAPIGPPLLIAQQEDQLQLTPTGWLIDVRRSKRLFER